MTTRSWSCAKLPSGAEKLLESVCEEVDAPRAKPENLWDKSSQQRREVTRMPLQTVVLCIQEAAAGWTPRSEGARGVREPRALGGRWAGDEFGPPAAWRPPPTPPTRLLAEARSHVPPTGSCMH